MPHDYRYDPFNDVSEAISITGETHVIPNNSPYTIRLKEVPKKDTPSSISLTIGGSAANEVSAAPASGEFWPDYSTKADSDDSWNTGTILFNAADAGKTVVVSYTGTGTLVDIEKTQGLHGCDIFTSSGTWARPSEAEFIDILLLGGGGGGGGGGTSPATGGNGGNSSFGGTLLVAGGGKGAILGTAAAQTGSVSTSSAEVLIETPYFHAGAVGAAGAVAGAGGDATGYGNGGGSGGYAGAAGKAGAFPNNNGIAGSSGFLGGGAGGGAVYAVAVPVDADTYNVVIGAGGIGGNSTYDGGDGSPGICIIWY